MLHHDLPQWPTRACRRGNGASVARIVPYAAIHFGSYEWFRQALVDRLSSHGPSSTAPVSPVWDLLAGSAAGGTAVLATYPLDLVRSGQTVRHAAP